MPEVEPTNVAAQPRETLADRVREHIRLHYGGNQSAFARKIGTDVPFVNRVVSGKTRLPEDRYIDVLVEELGITRMEFMYLAGYLREEDLQPGLGELSWSSGTRHLAEINESLSEQEQDALIRVAEVLRARTE